MDDIERYLTEAADAGCPADQVRLFSRAGILLQPRQLAASAAARACDKPGGPTAVGYGGARGGGKSHWLLTQMGADDCQRRAGLKCLLLRKVGKANMEHFEDLRRKLFSALEHEFVAYRGILTFGNGSRIIAGHFQTDRDIDAYLGLEYDVIGIEEATMLSARKHLDISTCCRSSRPDWRPRIYSTTNPGGVGHAWYREKFIRPFERGREVETRFVPARVTDNTFNNPEYRKVLENLSGWQRRAWLEGDWDIAAGQYFRAFRREAHVVSEVDDRRAVEWSLAMDYGYTHYTVFLLGFRDGDGRYYVVDEHAERLWLPERHAEAVRAMIGRHTIADGRDRRPMRLSDVRTCYAGGDVFSRESGGRSVAQQYRDLGIRFKVAAADRIAGWAEVIRALGDPSAGIAPRLLVHERCARLADCLPSLQHDPQRPEDVLKVDCDEEGVGGDDPADCLRYLLSGRVRARVEEMKLVGF